MGIVLLVIGAGWALIGLGNLVGMFGHSELSSTVWMLGLMFNMLMFVLPGGAVAALGELLRRRKSVGDGAGVPGARMPCPQCGESIAAAATVCRFCGTSVAPRVTRYPGPQGPAMTRNTGVAIGAVLVILSGLIFANAYRTAKANRAAAAAVQRDVQQAAKPTP